ncbi:MAG: S1/P1 nuclease [Rhodothermales bacterium]|nr:S1/P1 nuclease [Rhodothermales bacterium]
MMGRRNAVWGLVLAALVSVGAAGHSGAPPASMWGATGHRIVGEIAQQYLTDEARRGLHALVADTSLAQLSTWADEIRSDPAYDCASTWHYVTIEDEDTYTTSRRNNRGDVLEAMHRMERILRDPTADVPRKRRALKFLVHFVGDVHQPLHVGRGEDRGGNEIRVHWFGELTNLHSVWDTRVIEHRGLSFTEYTRFINHPSEADVARWQRSTCVDWAEESQALRDELYSVADLTDYLDRDGRFNLGYEYAYRTSPIIHRRLVQAGVRLAGLLNAIFGGTTETTCAVPEVEPAAGACALP